MGCQVCTDSMSALLDSELADSERRSVEEHIGECQDCQGELESLRFSHQLCSALAQVSVPASLWDRVEAEIQPDHHVVPTAAGFDFAAALRRLMWPGLATATVALAAFFLLPSFLEPQYPERFEVFLQSRETLYRRNVARFSAADFDFHRGSANPFIRTVGHTDSNPFR